MGPISCFKQKSADLMQKLTIIADFKKKCVTYHHTYHIKSFFLFFFFILFCDSIYSHPGHLRVDERSLSIFNNILVKNSLKRLNMMYFNVIKIL